MGNGDAVGVVIGVFNGGCGCFGTGISTRIGGSSDQCVGAITIVVIIANTGDSDGLCIVPIAWCKCQRVGAEAAFSCCKACDADGDVCCWCGIQNNSECGRSTRFCGEEIGTVCGSSLINCDSTKCGPSDGKSARPMLSYVVNTPVV